MTSTPPDEALHWATRATGAGVTTVRGLRAGGVPWLLRFDSGETAVLRTGTAAQDFATEVAALELAARHGIPSARLIAADHRTGWILTTVVPGTSRIPREQSRERLTALGRAAAALHALTPEPTTALPVRRGPIDLADAGYLAVRDGTNLPPPLTEAAEKLALRPVPTDPDVFVHGDLWQGNTLWLDGRCTGVVDWECAGTGPAGIDLGSLRCDAALLGGDPDAVLDGWREVTGHDAPNTAHWDVVAALSTPVTLSDWLPAIHDQGRDDIDAPTADTRRDAFLRSALDRL